MAEEGDLDFEEGMLWLPAHILEDASVSKEILERRQQKQQQQQQQQHHHKTLLISGDPFPPHSFRKPGPKLHQRPRYPAYRASGGPGMQAIFIDSGQRSCGTGVFLPRKGGFNFQQTKKAACSPVLLPSRVVQALNLNVHELGSQLTPQRYLNNKNGRNNDVVDDGGSTAQCCVSSQACSSSSKIFLPEEWSY
ncbi:hypothetical protein NE237_015382 [Protea cynaroides]|uniref:Uncharacterized protein n=1 Tax=Protea cynaroides TaxID=273540 RepID=A0A9Q0KDU4_9MAGN|nr:hypothetical protein NE237_015382 [Protea cynaroides]